MSKRRRERKPVLGPFTRAVSKAEVGDEKRRKVLIAIAAYSEAGIVNPTPKELAAATRLPEDTVRPLIERLRDDGFIRVKTTVAYSVNRQKFPEYRTRFLRGRE
ncbi:MAG: hypothetical protein AABM42_02135 [Actinomycetota bacterium]